MDIKRKEIKTNSISADGLTLIRMTYLPKLIISEGFTFHHVFLNLLHKVKKEYNMDVIKFDYSILEIMEEYNE